MDQASQCPTEGRTEKGLWRHERFEGTGSHEAAGKGEEETRTGNCRTWYESPSAQGKQYSAMFSEQLSYQMHQSEFFKSLSANLTRLRKTDREKRQQLYGADVPSEDYSEGEEDEYQYRTTRSKRHKVE